MFSYLSSCYMSKKMKEYWLVANTKPHKENLALFLTLLLFVLTIESSRKAVEIYTKENEKIALENGEN